MLRGMWSGWDPRTDAVFHYRNVISVGSADLEKQCNSGVPGGASRCFSPI